MKAIATVVILFGFLLLGGNSNSGENQIRETLSGKPTFDNFLGVNSVREPDSNRITDHYQIAKNHRIFSMDSYVFTGEEMVQKYKKNHYTVDLSKPHDEYPNDKMGFNPAKGAGGFDFDGFLAAMKSSGINSIPVLAKNLLYTNVPENNIVNVWHCPNDSNTDPLDPMSYKAFSSFLFQISARYGSAGLLEEGGIIHPDLIKVDQKNQALAGLDLIYAIEPGNEMDKDWFTDEKI